MGLEPGAQEPMAPGVQELGAPVPTAHGAPEPGVQVPTAPGDQELGVLEQMEPLDQIAKPIGSVMDIVMMRTITPNVSLTQEIAVLIS